MTRTAHEPGPTRRTRSRLGWSMTLVAACTAVLLGSAAGTAVAVETTTYQISGSEYAFTPTVGSFAGVATTSGKRGLFNAVVPHTVLNPNATITPGGSFTISGPAPVRGQFTGGNITLTSSPSGCRNEVYNVTGQLATTRGAGTFAVTLTHFRTPIGGRCLTYFARVVGQAVVPR